MISKYLPITNSYLFVAVNTVAVSGKKNRPTHTKSTLSHAWEANILSCLSCAVQLHIVIKIMWQFPKE
jgi:hypothetical protein